MSTPSKDQLSKSTQHDSKISLRPNTEKKSAAFLTRPEPEGIDKKTKAVFSRDSQTKSYMDNWKNTIDEVKKHAYNLTHCWDLDKSDQEEAIPVASDVATETHQVFGVPKAKKRSTKTKDIDIEAGAPEQEDEEENTFLAVLKKLLIQKEAEEESVENPVIPPKKARMTATLLNQEPTTSLIPTTVETIANQWPACKTLNKVNKVEEIEKESTVIQTQPQHETNVGLTEDQKTEKPMKVLWKPLVAQDVSPKYDEKTPSFMSFTLAFKTPGDIGKKTTQVTEPEKSTRSVSPKIDIPKASLACAAHGSDDVESCVGAAAAIENDPSGGATGTSLESVEACSEASAGFSFPRSSPTDEDSAILSWEAEVSKQMDDVKLQDSDQESSESIITPWLGSNAGHGRLAKPRRQEQRSFKAKRKPSLGTKESKGHRFQQPRKQPSAAARMKPRKHGAQPY